MLAIYIMLGILAVIALLLIMPVKLKVDYNEELRCILYVGFVKYMAYPQKPKKKKKKTKKSAEKKPEQKETEKKKSSKKNISWVLNVIKQVANLANGVLKDFFKHIIVKKLILSLSVAGSDAADTAIKYGKCCAVVYPAIGTLAGTVKCKHYGVDIAPNFDEKAKSKLTFELEAKTIVLWLLMLVIKHGYKGVKLLLDLRK